jgi:GntR family transcriptional regulator
VNSTVTPRPVHRERGRSCVAAFRSRRRRQICSNENLAAAPPPIVDAWANVIDATILGVMSPVKPPPYRDTELALSAVDRADPTYLHEQVAAEIRRAIADGEAKPGERIPQAKDLAAVLGVNTNTVLRALRLLRDEGLLQVGRGRAITVAGTLERGAVLARMKELVEFGRRNGYRRDELVEMLQALPG